MTDKRRDRDQEPKAGTSKGKKKYRTPELEKHGVLSIVEGD